MCSDPNKSVNEPEQLDKPNKVKPEDYEPGWGGLAILLWPIRAYMKIEVWIHNRLHPDDPQKLG